MAAGVGGDAVRDILLQPRALMRAIAAILPALLLAAACSGSERLVLPGQADLKLASGDRIKLCTDDGVEDTTPMSDCVIVERSSHPVAPYAAQLAAKGWLKVSGGDAGPVAWRLGEGPACRQLVIDDGREVMSRKRFAVLRFELGVCT